jgi:hypothetical protein
LYASLYTLVSSNTLACSLECPPPDTLHTHLRQPCVLYTAFTPRLVHPAISTSPALRLLYPSTSSTPSCHVLYTCVCGDMWHRVSYTPLHARIHVESRIPPTLTRQPAPLHAHHPPNNSTRARHAPPHRYARARIYTRAHVNARAERTRTHAYSMQRRTRKPAHVCRQARARAHTCVGAWAGGRAGGRGCGQRMASPPRAPDPRRRRYQGCEPGRAPPPLRLRKPRAQAHAFIPTHMHTQARGAPAPEHAKTHARSFPPSHRSNYPCTPARTAPAHPHSTGPARPGPHRYPS